MESTTSKNPYTSKEIATYTKHTPTQVESLLQKANERFATWRSTPFSERKKLIQSVVTTLEINKTKYAQLITAEMGKPISQSIAEIEKCAWLCKYYASEAEKQLADQTIVTDASKSYVSFEPLGVVLAIMPWNYPFWQVFRFAIPALMAGNIPVLKHASNVTGSAIAIENIFKLAGLPPHCFTTLVVGGNAMEQIIENPIIKAVALTGSGPAGSATAATAGKNLKKTVLELGGNNALIVLDDCDIATTIESCVQARFQNTGQSCIAGKRLLLQKSIYTPFVEKLIEKIRHLKCGDPQDKATFISVLAREDLAKELEQQVTQTIKAGGKLLLGGKRKGAFFEPTLVTEVTPEMPMFKEETFGPALSITTFNTIDEAIALSNNSYFGLGVSIFTKDVKSIQPYLYKFDEGAVFVNEMVKSDPRLPFGGIKNSGYGRELGSDGIMEFVNRKTIYIKQ